MARHTVRLIAAFVVMAVVAGCTAGDSATPTSPPAPSAVASTSASPSASAGTSAGETATVACSTADVPAGDVPGWPLAGGVDAELLPVIASSLVTAGRNRFLYDVLDADYRQLAAADRPSRIDFYALERDPGTPVAQVEADYLPAGPGRGLYRTEVDFDCVGEWGAEVFVQADDGTWVGQRLRFAVHEGGSTPAIGAPVPLSDSLTATTAEEMARISSDPDPYLRAYDKTVAETVTAGRPSLVFFATPAFCQTGFCGPTVELVKDVAREHEDVVEYVNVEPYELHMTENGLQPRLTTDGQLQPVAAALEWGIPVEPYLFLLDAEGKVFAKFEGLVGTDELRAAVADVLSA